MIIMSRSFSLLVRRGSAADRALSDQRGAGSYQVTPAEQRAGATGQAKGTKPATAWLSLPHGALPLF
ncbi:MAG: hypothetical protein M3Y74_22495 [Chloroflexota bacterium]|nr:hypothetical protein [Chloroflexota bacterium]